MTIMYEKFFVANNEGLNQEVEKSTFSSTKCVYKRNYWHDQVSQENEDLKKQITQLRQEIKRLEPEQLEQERTQLMVQVTTGIQLTPGQAALLASLNKTRFLQEGEPGYLHLKHSEDLDREADSLLLEEESDRSNILSNK